MRILILLICLLVNQGNALAKKSKRTNFMQPEICPVEKELAKRYLLLNGFYGLIPHNYRESDRPMYLDLKFYEKNGKLMATPDLARVTISDWKFILKGAHPNEAF